MYTLLCFDLLYTFVSEEIKYFVLSCLVTEIDYYLLLHVKQELSAHAFLLIVYYKVTISKLQSQNTAFNELPYLLNHNRQREKKITIIRYICLKMIKSCTEDYVHDIYMHWKNWINIIFHK